MSANFFSAEYTGEFMGRRCPDRPGISRRMRARQFIWGQTRHQGGRRMPISEYVCIVCTLNTLVVSYNYGGVWEVLQMHWVGGSINKTAAMPDMPKPNQTRRAEKTQAAHRGLPNQERKGRSTHHYSSNLVSDRGQEHGFQSVKKAVTISGNIMWFRFVEWWAGLLFPMSYWFGGSIY